MRSVISEFLKQNFPNVPSRRAFFLETDTRLAVYAHWSDRVAEDLRHEVAHGYMHSVVPRIPLWLDEGLAEYFEVPRGQGGLNRPHVDLLSDMAEQEHWRPNLPRLEKLTDAAQMDQRDYAESWAWVYFFLNSPPERREVLTDYLAHLRNSWRIRTAFGADRRVAHRAGGADGGIPGESQAKRNHPLRKSYENRGRCPAADEICRNALASGFANRSYASLR